MRRGGNLMLPKRNVSDGKGNRTAEVNHAVFTVRLDPQRQTPAQHVREGLFNVVANLLVVIACAEVPGDHQLVLKSILTLYEIVKMHMPHLTDLFLAVTGCNKRHLRDEHLGAVHFRTGIEPFDRAVA